MWKDAKYFLAYLTPIAVFIAIYFQSWWSYSGFILAFVIIPTLDAIVNRSEENFSEDSEQQRLSVRFFDWLLYLNVPLVYGLVAYFCYTVTQGGLATYELVGLVLSVGILVGVNGINVAHELGHRSTTYEQNMSKLLLLPGLYQHFFIEHNLGHHKHVATPNDPATSRLGETIYAFWWRSVTGSYLSAWRIETNRLQKQGLPFYSWHNQMLRYSLYTILYLGIIASIFGPTALLFAIAAGITGFLLLESVNYIEHYGLVRSQMASGRYEPVQPHHSWNSNHEVGRIFLYELTRHSDHHFKANRKYQVLRHFNESPQLPQGYPASILMSLVPPLWFSRMNKRVAQARKIQQAA